MSDNITDEFVGVDLKDRRRDRRLMKVVAALADAPSASLCAASGGWAEIIATYRLLSSDEVTPKALLAPHQAAVAQRCAQHSCVIVAQDTTELDFTAMKSTAGLGPLSDENLRGFYMHGLYAVSEGGLPLGIVEAIIVKRDDENFRINSTRKQRPIEEKESIRWIEGYLRTCELARSLPEGCEVFSVSDREGDIYELFDAGAQAAGEGGSRAEWLVRANQDRALLGITEGDPSKLFAALEASPELGQIEFQITAKKWRKTKNRKGSSVAAPRSARTVVQSVRAMKITPRPPARPGGVKLAPTSFWAVLAEEIDPPEGEDPVRWVLLTSKPVETFEEACRMVKLYLRRWDIEVFHRVLKTGCRVEQIQLKTAEALIKALMIYSVIAWRILYLTHLGRHSPELPCGTVFSEGEWKATCAVVKRPAIAGEPTIGEFIKIVGKLGGHLGRKSDGPPGPQSIWRGMERVRDFGQAWQVMHADGR